MPYQIWLSILQNDKKYAIIWLGMSISDSADQDPKSTHPVCSEKIVGFNKFNFSRQHPHIASYPTICPDIRSRFNCMEITQPLLICTSLKQAWINIITILSDGIGEASHFGKTYDGQPLQLESNRSIEKSDTNVATGISPKSLFHSIQF